MLLEVITEFNIFLLFLAFILGFLGGLFDNSFGMGYGLLLPIFIFLGFDLLIIIPIMLLSQAITGFCGTIFHQLNKNVNFSKINSRETQIYLLFITTGIIGTILAVIFAITFPNLFILIYIGLMMIILGLIVLFKFRFKTSPNKLIYISVIAGFNKAISGGGYGPLVTSGQLMSGGKVRNSVGVTQFSESTISIIGFLLYFIFNDFVQIILTLQLAIIMILSGILSAPIGAMISRKLEEELARKIVAVLSMCLGTITLFRILLL